MPDNIMKIARIPVDLPREQGGGRRIYWIWLNYKLSTARVRGMSNTARRDLVRESFVGYTSKRARYVR